MLAGPAAINHQGSYNNENRNKLRIRYNLSDYITAVLITPKHLENRSANRVTHYINKKQLPVEGFVTVENEQTGTEQEQKARLIQLNRMKAHVEWRLTGGIGEYDCQER